MRSVYVHGEVAFLFHQWGQSIYFITTINDAVLQGLGANMIYIPAQVVHCTQESTSIFTWSGLYMSAEKPIRSTNVAVRSHHSWTVVLHRDIPCTISSRKTLFDDTENEIVVSDNVDKDTVHCRSCDMYGDSGSDLKTCARAFHSCYVEVVIHCFWYDRCLLV